MMTAIEKKNMKREKDTKEDTTAMYIVFNADLLPSVGKGKIAAQCCHAACAATRILDHHSKYDPVLKWWLQDGEAKIVLKATAAEMLKMLDEFEVDKVAKRDSNVWCTAIRDAGKTQIASRTLTAIAFRPLLRAKAPNILANLKLL